MYAYLLNNYRDQGDYKEALQNASVIIEMAQKYQNCLFCQISYAVTGSVYYEMNQPDSALYYLSKALEYPKTLGYGWVLLMNGRIQARINNSDLAMRYYKQSLVALQADNNLKDLAGAYNSIAELYERTGSEDSAVYYGKEALNLARQRRFLKEVLQSYLFLSTIYEKKNTKVALDYYRLAMAAKDSLYNQEKQRQEQSWLLVKKCKLSTGY